MRPSLLLLLLPLLMTRTDAAPAFSACFDVPTNAPPRELTLCGNGVLDEGELCDDGNQVDGDGCNAFCSAFDALTAATTLAGGNTPCPNGRTVLGSTTSNTLFCHLRAVETTLDGAAVLLADEGTLLRYSLFTDRLSGAITQLEASIENQFTTICSIGVLGPDGTILIHDCGQGRFYAAMADGTRTQLVADFSAQASATAHVVTLKSYYNRTARYAVTAGVLRSPQAEGGCIGVYGLTVSPFDANRLVTGTRSTLALIPCTAYGVWESGTQITSFDVRGMLPHLVLRERCPPTFRAGQACYVVHLQRPAHMEFLRAYIPEDGGLDLQYYASTRNLYDNALGAPLVRYGGALTPNRMVYTLRGACLQSESRFLTHLGAAPTAATLGNACRRTPQLGLACATPFNNPFITDVVTSPVLLPFGLSATHTHGELTAIFGGTCPPLANVTSAGPLLYQSTLATIYGNTTPVDFVELASTLDLIFVTPTSVGLISTKRMHLADRTQPGYVRATNVIYCPQGRFGSVGGVCHQCNATDAPGYYVSVAWQIQCAKPSVQQGITPPYETFTIIASKHVTEDTLRAGVCVFTESKNVSCPPVGDLTLLPPQQFNLDADASDAAPPNTVLTSSSSTDLIQCLIHEAELATGTPLFRPNLAEYNARVVSQGSAMLTAGAQLGLLLPNANYSDGELGPAIAMQCKTKMAKGLGTFLACAVPKHSAGVADQRRRARRLLQLPDVPADSMTEHQAVAVGSSTIISWTRSAPGQRPDGTDLSAAPPPIADGGAVFPVWAGIAIGIACAVVLLGLACVVMVRRRKSLRLTVSSTAARFLSPPLPTRRTY
jgi:cysteine-rich repeat protein